MMRAIDRIYGGIHIKTVYEVALCPACIAQSEMTERISLPLNENRPWFVSGLQFSAAVVYAVSPARVIYDNESIRFVPSLRLTEAGVDSAIANLNCHDIVATNLTRFKEAGSFRAVTKRSYDVKDKTEGRVFNPNQATAAARVGFSGSPPLPLKSLTMASISEPSKTSRSRSDSATL